MAKTMRKPRKIKKTFSRRKQSGWAACPTTNFWKFKDYARTEMDKKEVAKTIKEYIKANFKKSEQKIMQAAPDWSFTLPYYVAATIEWDKLGFDVPLKWNSKKMFKKYFDELTANGEQVIADKLADGENPTQKRTIADIIKERTHNFIASIEEVIDDYHWQKENAGRHTKALHDVAMDYSVYDELKKIDAPYNIAKATYTYFNPLKLELVELVEKKTPDLVEAWSFLSQQQRKRYQQFIAQIVDDAEKYMMSKKAVRKTRIAKPKAADKQVQHFKYLPESPEFKLTSINPVKIIGAHRLFTFNVKSRIITEYVCKSSKGFEIKGSTLQEMDELNSRETRLRKPEEFLTMVLKSNPNKVGLEWKKLTTKTNSPNARVNKDNILLKVVDK